MKARMKLAQENTLKNQKKAKITAIANKNLELLKDLYNKDGGDINDLLNDNYDALFVASSIGDLSIVKYLCEMGAGINTIQGNRTTSLLIASQKGNLDIVRYLYERGADLNMNLGKYSTVLFNASKNGHIEVVKYLHKNGAKINVSLKTGATPLSLASKNGYVEVVKYLIENGAESILDAKGFVDQINEIHNSSGLADMIVAKNGELVDDFLKNNINVILEEVILSRIEYILVNNGLEGGNQEFISFIEKHLVGMSIGENLKDMFNLMLEKLAIYEANLILETDEYVAQNINFNKNLWGIPLYQLINDRISSPEKELNNKEVSLMYEDIILICKEVRELELDPDLDLTSQIKKFIEKKIPLEGHEDIILICNFYQEMYSYSMIKQLATYEDSISEIDLDHDYTTLQELIKDPTSLKESEDIVQLCDYYQRKYSHCATSYNKCFNWLHSYILSHLNESGESITSTFVKNSAGVYLMHISEDELLGKISQRPGDVEKLLELILPKTLHDSLLEAYDSGVFDVEPLGDMGLAT